MMALEPGHGVGPYEILAVLGSGGMGTVYLARDTRLDRRVALKFIRSAGQALDDEESRRRLLHEARAASALNHPNICHIYDVGGEGRESWIAMEYVEGQPLASAIPAGGLPPDAVIRTGSRLADALAHAHSRGILHRDLKAANIVYDRDGHPKILDFGIAGRVPEHVVQGVTRTATTEISSGLAGTLPYLAPEVLKGEPQDARADLWSLGIVLYEMLTGARPFDRRSAFETAAAILHNPVPALPAAVPPPLARIVMRLLAANREHRYGAATEVAAALDALLIDRAAGQAGGPSHAVLIAAAGLLAIGAALVVWNVIRYRPLNIASQHLVSADEGMYRAPSYAPNGLQLAFVAPDTKGVAQIWVRDLERNVSIQLTNGDVPAGRPRWVPKTNQIIFARAGQGIWMTGSVGGTPTRLIDSGTNPNVSRNAARLVFENAREIWTAAIDGSDIRKVEGVQRMTYGLPRGPSLSPDGSTIAYFRADLGPNGDFWAIPSGGGTPKRLTSDLREGGWPVWTPDGRAIVFSSARAGSRTLWQVPAGGGEPRPLTTGAGEDDQPDISADGRQLAYTNVRNTWELHVRESTTGADRALLQRGLELLFPMFSPDGRRITYFGRSDFAVAIFTIGVDGSDPRQLTGGRELNHQPRWSADGHDVYFFQSWPAVGLRRVPALGGPSTEFRPWDWSVQNAPYFDPTGRFLAYLKQRPPGAPSTVKEHTVIQDVHTGGETEWPEPHTHVTGWAQDGATLVGWQHDPNRVDRQLVVACQVADRVCRTLAQGSVAKWLPGSNRIFFMRAAGSDSQQLWSVGLDGSAERHEMDLGAFRSLDVFFDVSRDGRICWAPFRPGHYELWTAAIR